MTDTILYFRSLEPVLEKCFATLPAEQQERYNRWQDLFLEELYARAKDKRQVRMFSLQGYNGKYACVSSGMSYEEKTGSFVYSADYANAFVRFAEQRGMIGMRTDTSSVLLKKSFRGNEDFMDIVGLHERVEQLGGSHARACFIEIGEVFLRGKDFSKRYALWFFHKEREHLEATCNAAIENISEELKREEDSLKRLKIFYKKLEEHFS